MIKVLRFWVQVLKGFLTSYEEAKDEFGIDPLSGWLSTKKKLPSVPKTRN